MSLPKEQEALANKFMSAVFAAGIEQCNCKACALLREMAKDFMKSKEAPQKAVKVKKT